MPYVFRDIDVISALGALMRLNTKHYQSDFAYDKEMFETAVHSEKSEDRQLLWMSRKDGTWCFLERDVFIRETDEHFTWLNYGDPPRDRLLTYAVEITGKQDGIIYGNLYELDYKSHAAWVEANALSTATVFATMNDGTLQSLSYERYDGYKEMDLAPSRHGGIAYLRYEPENSAELTALLQREHAYRDMHTIPGNIEKHIKRLTEPKKQSIQKQLANGEKQAAKDNAARPTPAKDSKTKNAER